MSEDATSQQTRAPRRAILDLAPLELDCMNALWQLGEATVRDIRKEIAPTRPRAYTTIMTIMDRLAQKGIVTREKLGRAYRYHANLTAEQARKAAVAHVVAGFFDGSAKALAVHLTASGGESHLREVGAPPRQSAAAPRKPRGAVAAAEPLQGREPAVERRLDATLL